MFKICVLKHSDGERLPILLDCIGFPLPDPNLFILTKRGMAWTTLKKKLEYIARFHYWAQKNQINISERVATTTLFSEEEINHSLFEFLRITSNDSDIHVRAISANTFNTKLLYIKEYLSWLFSSMLMRLPSSDPKFQLTHTKQQIVLKWLTNLKLSKSIAQSDLIKSLDSAQLEFLYDIVDPKSSLNPWLSIDIRERNFLILKLLVGFGIRPAELLTIRVTDFDFSSISSLQIIRRPHDAEDPRLSSPEVKRKGRVLPILDMTLAKLIDRYIVDWRPKFEVKNTKGTDFLILSDDGNPLSYPAIAKLFVDIRNASKDKLPATFTAGWLRHTFSSFLETKMRHGGIPEQRRREILMQLRGDTSPESQNVYLHAAIKEEAQNILKTYQEEIFRHSDVE